MAEEKALEIIAETAGTIVTNVANALSNPDEVGRKLVNISRYGHNVRMSMRRELQFNRLLRRMYDTKGDVTHQIAVPHIDMLSDLDRDLLLHGEVPPEHVASFFEATFVLSNMSNRLTDISRLTLHETSNLVQSLADIEYVTDGKMGVVPLTALSVMWLSQPENPHECVFRFDTTLKSHGYFSGKIGFAKYEVSKFLDIAKSRQTTPIIFNEHHFRFVTREVLIESQVYLVALAMNDEKTEAELFYKSTKSSAVLDVVRVNHSGVFASCPEDFKESEEFKGAVIKWVPFMTILMYQSLQLVTSFPIKEISVTLLEAIATDPDENRFYDIQLSHPKQIPKRGLIGISKDYNQVCEYVTAMQKIIMLSSYVREAATEFAQLGPNETRPKFALTFAEMKKEPAMSVFSYNHRDVAIQKIKENVKNKTMWTKRRPITEHPFETAGLLDYMATVLKEKIRTCVKHAQKTFRTGWKTLEPAEVSGSLWLDRIAKGKLLTSERAQELTKNKIRKTVPRELRCKREVGFYLPMYDRTIVFPNEDDLSNIKYMRMQIGSATDLISAVSVLVAIIMWTNAQHKKVVEKAIKEDERGTQNLINYTEGELGNAIHDAFQETINEQSDGDDEDNKGLKISTLIDIVGDLQGEKDNAWIVREVLSIAAFWGMTYTERTKDSAGYLETVMQVRSVNATGWQVINANRAVPFTNVKMSYIKSKEGPIFFRVQDSSIPKNKVVVLEPIGGDPEDLKTVILSENTQLFRPIVTKISVRDIDMFPTMRRPLVLLSKGNLKCVSVL